MNRGSLHTMQLLMGRVPAPDGAFSPALAALLSSEPDADDLLRDYKAQVRGVADYVVRGLLATPDLDEAIDLLLEDPHYHERWMRCARALPWGLLERMAHETAPKLDVSGLPDATKATLRLATRLDVELVSAMLKLMAASAQSGQAPPPQLSPMWFMREPLPPVVKQGFLGRVSADIASLGASAILAEADRPQPRTGLIEALAERWLLGRRQFAAVLESVGVIEMDQELLPLRFRFDSAGTVRFMRRSYEGLEHAMRMVARTGRGFPEVLFLDEE